MLNVSKKVAIKVNSTRAFMLKFDLREDVNFSCRCSNPIFDSDVIKSPDETLIKNLVIRSLQGAAAHKHDLKNNILTANTL